MKHLKRLFIGTAFMSLIGGLAATIISIAYVCALFIQKYIVERYQIVVALLMIALPFMYVIGASIEPTKRRVK